MSQIIQFHLNCHLDDTSPRPASTSASAAASGGPMPGLQEAVPVVTSQDVLANALLTFTRKSSHLSRRAHQRTVDFHSQVRSPLKMCSQMHC